MYIPLDYFFILMNINQFFSISTKKKNYFSDDLRIQIFINKYNT